jgi:hypothetical protein
MRRKRKLFFFFYFKLLLTDFVGYVGDTNGNLKKKQKRKFDEEN